MVDNNEILEQVLQLGQTLNAFQLQTTASFNELRAEIKENKKEIQKSREIENAHWEENKRLWAENKKRWEENDKRWEKYEIDRKTDYKELLDILTQFDRTISKKIGDPNAEKMNKIIDISKIKR